MNDEVKKQLEEICSKQHVELPDHLALTWEYNSAWMAGARAAWELATKPTPERGDITPKVTEDDERDAKEEFSAPHDGYAHGGLSASQTGYRSECARCRWLFDDVVPPRGDPTPLGVCGFKLTRIRKLFYDAGRLGLREAVEAAVERERERILKLVDGPYGCNPYDLKIEILNPPPEGGRRVKTVPFDEGFKERLKDPEYAFTVIRAISVDYERDIDALEAKVKAQAELLERAVESINFLIVYGEQFPIKRARAEILMADLEKLQSEEAGEKE